MAVVGVAGTTLLAQGLTPPRVIRALKMPGDAAAADRSCFGLKLGLRLARQQRDGQGAQHADADHREQAHRHRVTLTSGQRVEFGLDLFIDGLAARLG